MDQLNVLFMCENDDLRVCRVCLSVDVRLFAIQPILADLYTQITGISITPTDNLPQYICALCTASLRRAAAFRHTCFSAHRFLEDCRLQYQVITTDYIRSLNLHHLKCPLSISIIETNEFTDRDEIDIKKETTIHVEDGIENDDNAFYSPIEYVDENGENTVETKMVDVIQNNDIKISENGFKDENLREYLLANAKSSDNENVRKFYEFVLEKYVDKSKSVIEDEEVLDSDEELLINYSKTKSIPNEIEKHKETFYNYIKNKYLNNKIKHKKVVGKSRVKTKQSKNYKTKEELDQFSKDYNVEIFVLNLEEQKLALQTRQDNPRYKKSKFKCELCFRGFSADGVYSAHVALHQPSAGSHECDVCRLRFPRRPALMKHLLGHKMKFVCRVCQKVAWFSSEAMHHYKTHAGVKYECEHCGKVFRRYASRVNHVRIHHGRHACALCHAAFASQAGLVGHVTKAHKETYKCDSCALLFASAAAREVHIATAPGGRCGADLHPCTRCGVSCSSEQALRQHVTDEHAKRALRTCTKKPQQIQKKCSKTIKKQSCECIDTDTCSCVPLSPTTAAPARQRQRYMCEMCAVATFSSEASLRYHQRVHTGEKPYQCSFCPKTFRIKELLQMHTRTHTGDRPYKCAHCAKTFKSYAANYRHQLVHNKVRRHRCPLCDKAFQTSSCVKLHVRTVHMKMPPPPRTRPRAR